LCVRVTPKGGWSQVLAVESASTMFSIFIYLCM
jgi:hypothetical protein